MQAVEELEAQERHALICVRKTLLGSGWSREVRPTQPQQRGQQDAAGSSPGQNPGGSCITAVGTEAERRGDLGAIERFKGQGVATAWRMGSEEVGGAKNESWVPGFDDSGCVATNRERDRDGGRRWIRQEKGGFNLSLRFLGATQTYS